MGGEPINFFISHAGADRAWAEWVAWQLEAAGYTAELDVWDWMPGQNFVTAMSDALDRADPMPLLVICELLVNWQLWMHDAGYASVDRVS